MPEIFAATYRYVSKLLILFLTLFFFNPGYSQVKTVKGNVKDEEGKPLAGVSIKILGTKKGTVTRDDGSFEISGLSSKDQLEFSFSGYTASRMVVGTGTDLVIELKKNSAALDEVVVVGYGNRKKSEVTGAISTVKAAELTQTPIANLAQGLQGRVAGLQITQNNAAPGGSINVRLRGTNSINGSSEPLYIIDGVQLQNNTGGGTPGANNQYSAVGGNANEVSPLSYLNPNDIESVEVLKDASAAAIYGSQAANGVIIITTKRGKSGTSKISYDGYYGIQSVTKKLPVLNAAEFARLENEIYNSIRFSNPDSLGKGTDWQDEIFRNARIQSHQLTFSGGNERTQVLMAFNYFNQEGVVLNSKFDRFSMRLNLDHTLNKWIKVGTATTLTRSINNRIQTGSIQADGGAISGSLIGAALQAPPVLTPYRSDGKTVYSWAEQQYGAYYQELRNPLAGLAATDVTTTNTILSNVYLDFNLFKGLKYRSTLNVFSNNGLNNYYFPGSAFTPAELSANGGLGGYGMKNNSNFIRLMHESVLSYDLSVKQHNFRLTGVYSIINNNSNSNYMTGNGFVNDATTNEALQLARNFSISTSRSKDNLISYLARISYNYQSRFFLDLTGRVDGSSKFGTNNKYGFFPAVSAAWNIKREAFLENIDVITNLRLRGGVGITGNQAAVDAYQSLAVVSSGSDYLFNNSYTRGIAPTGIPNPDLRWEKSTQGNIGLEVDLFSGRLNFTGEAYLKTTTDLIFQKSLPLSSGYERVLGNFASLENRGLEFSLGGSLIRRQDVSWTVSANISINRNKLLRLSDDTTNTFAINNYNELYVGQPLGLFRTYVYDGLHQLGETILPGQPVTNPRPGTHKVKDVSGPQGKPDGRITQDDRLITGDANPDFVYGFSSNFRYKQLDLSVLFSGVYGNEVFNLSRWALENPIGSRNLLASMTDRWTTTNTDAENQVATGSLGGRLPLSDKYLEDGSFLRCKNITIGYSLKNVLKFSNARIYVSANNLFTITKYSGFDPEIGSFGNSNTQFGVDNIVYPVSKSILFGIQLTL